MSLFYSISTVVLVIATILCLAMIFRAMLFNVETNTNAYLVALLVLNAVLLVIQIMYQLKTVWVGLLAWLIWGAFEALMFTFVWIMAKRCK